MQDLLHPPRLVPGDRVHFVSPASTPAREDVDGTAAYLATLGLRATIGPHAFAEHGYLAGTDEQRLADLNEALRDPEVRAVIATRGGKGAYRIADDLDLAAVRRDPKLLIGFSEITVLQLALWRGCRVPAIHGAPFEAQYSGQAAADSFVRSVLTTDDTAIGSDPAQPTSALTTSGRASGYLVGGNQDMVACAAGWVLPPLDGAILLLEGFRLGLGQVDRQLTMLLRGGQLAGVRGVAVGQYTDCGPTPGDRGGWTVIDVLRDRLALLGVPVLGGLPIGHEDGALAVPVGTQAVLDADAGTLTVQAAVR